jgi:hypothetical protein
MGKFTGIKTASVSGGGVYFLSGLYVIEVKKCMMINSRKREDLFIVECEIIESNNEKRPEGFSASWVVKMSQDAALGNIKGFICAAYDCAESDVDEDACELIVDEANPLKGTILNLECVDITTRAGTPFTLHKWSKYAD